MDHGMSRSGCGLSVALAALLALLSSCAFYPTLPPPKLEGEWEVRRIEAEAIAESSGLVRSRRHAGVFWTHNDSGDAPRIFAITAEGRLLGEFAVEGVRHRDWEDIAVDGAGNLYLGDYGNNGNARQDLVVYRVPEPDPFGAGRVARADRVLAFRYADQDAFPARGRRNFDAESLFWMEGALYIFTKHRSDTQTKLYRLPVEEPFEGKRALEPLARFELGGKAAMFFGNATGADLRDDGRVLALLSYGAIHLFERTEEEARPFRPLRRIELARRRTRLAESIAWDGPALLFGNEQRYLFRIPDPLAPGLERYPSSAQRTRMPR
jgi:hypothetical protein